MIIKAFYFILQEHGVLEFKLSIFFRSISHLLSRKSMNQHVLSANLLRQKFVRLSTRLWKVLKLIDILLIIFMLIFITSICYED